MIKLKLKDKEIKRLQTKVKRQMGSTARLMSSLSKDMLAYVMGNFETEGHGKWPALADSTVEARRAKGKEGKMLQVSCKLRNNINARSGERVASVGTNKVYARILNDGGEINHPGGTKFFINKDGKMIFVKKSNPKKFPVTKPHKISLPARPFLAFQDTEVDKMQKKIRKYFMEPGE